MEETFSVHLSGSRFIERSSTMQKQLLFTVIDELQTIRRQYLNGKMTCIAAQGMELLYRFRTYFSLTFTLIPHVTYII